jgi:pimeloyl-ACP methyl ester carboxylesterase
MSMELPDVVLLHGLYHQPAHMQPLVEELEKRGVNVHVPTLHRGSLAADIVAAQHAVNASLRRPIVVGHSYGGAVAAGVEGAAALVFIAAFVLDLGESCAALSGLRAPVNAWTQPHPSGGTFIPADAARELFYGDCDPVAAENAIALLTRQAAGHGRGIATRAAWRELPSKYIVCADDRAVDPALQKRLALRCTDSYTISTSHSPYISQPVLTADAILGWPYSDSPADKRHTGASPDRHELA